MARHPVLQIQNFAQIGEAKLAFGDLTILVGAQGSGKSIALQWLKVALDGKQVLTALKEAGNRVSDEGGIIDLIFGNGMGSAWASDSKIFFNKRSISPKTLSRIGNGVQTAFFVPAHRSMLISDGWASPFQKLSPDTPVVARIFSQNLYDRFSAKGGDQLFPLDKLLKKSYRQVIDAAVYHGGTVGLDQDLLHTKRLKLSHGGTKLPFMTWTAGQREFTPLLLGLYHLLPRTKVRKHNEIDWVIIEEPEMGLHPQAVTAFLLLTLDLLWRGYRVVISTHSPHLLTGIWMLQRLKAHKAKWQRVCQGLGADTDGLKAVAENALTKDYKVYFMELGDNGKAGARDISGLDPDSEDDSEAGWGGLTGFSSQFGNAVRKAVLEGEA